MRQAFLIATLRCGGAPFNVAVYAARQGADVRFFGNVGSDSAGAFLKEQAQTFGLDLRLTQSVDCPTTVALRSKHLFKFVLPFAAQNKFTL